MSTKEKEIFVYADWGKPGNAVQMGTLYSEMIRGSEVFSFAYTDQWLQAKSAFMIDPDLQLFGGRQYIRGEKPNFGIFLDSAPDRWGRVLMKRRESVLARIDGRPERRLVESDYLLGVYDENRQGGIRFKAEADGEFLNQDRFLAAPPFSSLRELQAASLMVEEDTVQDASKYIQWLNLLLAPGSSLGGARPKASVTDEAGNLWIAKFPSTKDVHDAGAWEMVVHEIARASGIDVPQADVHIYSGKSNTFMVKRFDRIYKQRIHFASAMTLLGYNDGASHSDGVSYLEIAEFIVRNGARVDADLEELWKRILLSVCVANTDDHLRNHGFLLTEQGWVLSPAYDMNPNENGTGLSLNITENDNSLEIENVLSIAEFFRVKPERAKEIVREIKESVSQWSRLADKYGIPRSEQLAMEKCFKWNK